MSAHAHSASSGAATSHLQEPPEKGGLQSQCTAQQCLVYCVVRHDKCAAITAGAAVAIFTAAALALAAVATEDVLPSKTGTEGRTAAGGVRVGWGGVGRCAGMVVHGVTETQQGVSRL